MILAEQAMRDNASLRDPDAIVSRRFPEKPTAQQIAQLLRFFTKASRATAGAFGFLILTQRGERPAR
jgi:hypothetical protein